jgi:hypothetical protein
VYNYYFGEAYTFIGVNVTRIIRCFRVKTQNHAPLYSVSDICRAWSHSSMNNFAVW